MCMAKMRVQFLGETEIRQITEEEFHNLSPERIQGMIVNPWTPEEQAQHEVDACRWRKENQKLPSILLDHLPRMMKAAYLDTWMSQPNEALGGRIPNELVKSCDFQPLIDLVESFNEVGC